MEFLGVGVEGFGFLGGGIDEEDSAVSGDEEEGLGEGVGVMDVVRGAFDGYGGGGGVGAGFGRDDGQGSAVLGDAVAGREDGEDFGGSGDWPGIDHDDSRAEVSEVGLGVGAVGICGPEVVEFDLGAIDVFPAGVEESSVGEDGGGVVVLGVCGDWSEVFAVGVAAVQDGDLGIPAIDPAFAAGGAEDDIAIGQVGWLDVVEVAGGQLAEV